MELFTIITTILELILASLSLKVSLNGNSTPPQNTSSNNHSYIPEYNVQNNKNQETLKRWLSWGISLSLPAILIFTIWYNWNNIPSTGSSISPFLNFLNNALYLGIGYTTKITSFTIPILSIGIIIKNIKNPSSQFRIFNILTYSFLTIASIWLILLVFKLDYLSFIPMANTSLDITTTNDILFNLLYTLGIIFPILQLLLIYFVINSASKELLFDRQFSNDLENNAKYIGCKILFILSFAFFIWYWIYIWK